MTKQILQVGFLGAGKSTHRYQGPFIAKLTDKFHIKTIWARNLSHVKWEQIPGAVYTENIDDVLQDPDIDLVVISLPVLHYEYTKKTLLAGKNVVCEKPFTESRAQAEELFDLAKEKGLLCMCIQNRRFDSDFLTAQAVIESGRIGDIYEVEMHYDYYRKDVVDAGKFDPFGSFLYQHACHTLDQAISYFGIPHDYHAEVKQLLGSGRMNDYFDIDLYYDAPLKVNVSSSYMRIKPRPKITVYGTKGMFVKTTEDRQEYDLKRFYLPTPDHPDFGLDRERDYGTAYYYNEHDEYVEDLIKTVNGDYSRYYEAVYDSIVSGAAPLVKPEETLKQLEILETGIKQCH